MARITHTNTNHPYVGKRVNVAGDIGTVGACSDDGMTCIVKYDKWRIPGVVFTSIIAEMPEVVSRASFNYRPA